jgi:hypothetical protein
VGTPTFGGAGEPDQFAFADGERFDRALAAGGFRHIHREAVDRPVRVGSDVDDVVGYVLSQPECQQLLAGHTVDQAAAAISAVRHALTPYASHVGVVMNESAWLVTAVR